MQILVRYLSFRLTHYTMAIFAVIGMVCSISGLLNPEWKWLLLVEVLCTVVAGIGFFHTLAVRRLLIRNAYYLVWFIPFRIRELFFAILMSSTVHSMALYSRFTDNANFAVIVPLFMVDSYLFLVLVSYFVMRSKGLPVPLNSNDIPLLEKLGREMTFSINPDRKPEAQDVSSVELDELVLIVNDESIPILFPTMKDVTQQLEYWQTEFTFIIDSTGVTYRLHSSNNITGEAVPCGVKNRSVFFILLEVLMIYHGYTREQLEEMDPDEMIRRARNYAHQ